MVDSAQCLLDMQSVTVLGATGSIGDSALDVLREHRHAYSVDVLVGGANSDKLLALALEFRPKMVAIADKTQGEKLKSVLEPLGIKSGAGESAVLDAASIPTDITLAAISGTAGLVPTAAALRRGGKIALANKECLVCAGQAFMRDAAFWNARILPVDSEHNALLQALGNGEIDHVDMLTLTASGGPFRNKTRPELVHVLPEAALKHPTWNMGCKVTIDSATLMNKGLELIEAHHLFGVEAERLDVLVHPQSIVHGLVSWRDGSVTAGLAHADMRIPIAHCLGASQRLKRAHTRLDLAAIGSLSFERIDATVFPAVRLAYAAMNMAGGATVYNAANEIAVAAFLEGRLGFLEISVCVAECLERMAGYAGLREPDTVEEALLLHALVQVKAADIIDEMNQDNLVTN